MTKTAQILGDSKHLSQMLVVSGYILANQLVTVGRRFSPKGADGTWQTQKSSLFIKTKHKGVVAASKTQKIQSSRKKYMSYWENCNLTEKKL